jgi:hypothetical protein
MSNRKANLYGWVVPDLANLGRQSFIERGRFTRRQERYILHFVGQRLTKKTKGRLHSCTVTDERQTRDQKGSRW